jgi:peptide/nickel transport system substrate-binding protein
LLALAATGASSPADDSGSASDAQSEQPSRADRVVIGFPRDDGTLTPYTFDIGYPLVTLVYDTLTGGAGLARRITKSNAGKLLTIRLHDKVKWHDGTPLTAADVVFTFGYVKRHYHPRFTPQLEAVKRVRARGRLTVLIDLRHPSLGFRTLPLSDLPILPKHIWQRLPANRVAPAGLPVGSGPYRLVEYRRGKRYVFRANHGYFLGRPRVERIVVPFIGNFERMVRDLQNRTIDMIPVTLPESTQEKLRSSVFRTKFGHFFTGTVLMFNLRRPPFDEPAVRRAVSGVLDIQRIARNEIIGGRDAVPADRGYVHPHSGWAAAAPIHRFDQARSRAVLSSRLRAPLRILVANNDPVRREAAREVRLALLRIGVRADVRELSARRLAAAVGQGRSTPTFQAAIWSSSALASNSPDFLRAIFGSGSPLNYSGYRSAEFDGLARKAARATNEERRRQLVRKQIGLLNDDAPVVPLFFPEGAFVFNPHVYDGWIYAAGAGILNKRSFLPRELIPVAGPATAAAPAAPPSGGPGIGVAGYVAFVLLGGVALFIASGYVTRRRRR